MPCSLGIFIFGEVWEDILQFSTVDPFHRCVPFLNLSHKVLIGELFLQLGSTAITDDSTRLV